MRESVLFINACVREESRTLGLAEKLLKALDMPFEELHLVEESFPRADAAFLEKRDRLLAEEAFSDPLFTYARQFAQAKIIVIAAPYWDLSFPSVLKQYLEQTSVIGISFRYTEEGIPEGLCQAKKLYYVTTVGGCALPHTFGYGYVQALAQSYYGIPETCLITAEGLDIVGADTEAILTKAWEEAQERI